MSSQILSQEQREREDRWGVTVPIKGTPLRGLGCSIGRDRVRTVLVLPTIVVWRMGWKGGVWIQGDLSGP